MSVERIPQSATKRVALKGYASNDHLTAATGKTIAVVISKNCAAFGNPSAGATNATEVSSGWYYVDLSATDTGTAGPLVVRATASGVDDIECEYFVVDAHNAGFDAMPSAVAGAAGGLPLGDASGRVDLGKWLGSAPNALQSGRVDSYLGAVAAGVIAAASFAAGALDTVWSTTARTLSTGAIVAGTFAANALDAVWAVAARTLTAGTNIVLAKGVGVTGFTDLSAAQVNTECDTALSDVGLTGTVTGRIDAAISSRSSHTAVDVAAQVTTDHGVGSYTRNSEPPTSAAIAAQVRTELTTELARVDVAISSRSTYAGADTSGTTTLLARLTAIRAGLLDNLDAAISAVKAKTDALPSDPADASDIASSFTAVASSLATVASYIDTEVAAIKAKTDLIPASPAATSDIPSAVTIATAVRTALATELARIDVALSTLSTYDGSDSAGVTTLLDRLSDARATLLDNLSNLDAAISAITFTLSSAERQAIADAYLDRVNGIEADLTPRQAERLLVAGIAGKASGMDVNTPVFRNYGDTKDRINATCDEFGNRLDVTVDVS